MTYMLVWRNEARQQLSNLRASDPSAAKSVMGAVRALAADPYPATSNQLGNSRFWRLRLGVFGSLMRSTMSCSLCTSTTSGRSLLGKPPLVSQVALERVLGAQQCYVIRSARHTRRPMPLRERCTGFSPPADRGRGRPPSVTAATSHGQQAAQQMIIGPGLPRPGTRGARCWGRTRRASSGLCWDR